jgi:ssDNA thymidine ADP-ribosyltransferase, DarT
VPGQIPKNPKIYHIVHVDRLESISGDRLWCDAEVGRRAPPGTTIGMSAIKQRRLSELTLTSHPGLFVGECVPFYFCPRSVMLYLIYQGNHPDLAYGGGQGPIIHIEADLRQTTAWAESQGLRWAFTLGNAGSYYFEDRTDLNQLDEIDWNAVGARNWTGCKEGKQAEFLIELEFPWNLVSRIGVRSRATYDRVLNVLQGLAHKPVVEMKPEWYY